MLTFFVRLVFFLLLARIAYFVLRGLGLVGSRSRPAQRPQVPPGPPGGSSGDPTQPGSPAAGLGGDIVDAEFEDLPNPGER